jgi:4-oxalocrotonate tautomerase family enzyme
MKFSFSQAVRVSKLKSDLAVQDTSEVKIMPIVNVKLVKGALRTEQQHQLISKITDAVESVYPGLRDVTFITIEEVNEWGIGGQPITAEKVAGHAKKNLQKS